MSYSILYLFRKKGKNYNFFLNLYLNIKEKERGGEKKRNNQNVKIFYFKYMSKESQCVVNLFIWFLNLSMGNQILLFFDNFLLIFFVLFSSHLIFQESNII